MEPTIRGYRGRVRDVRALVESIAKLDAPMQLLRADRIYGADHLRLATSLARRALAEGRARTAALPTETMLYAAGERQIGRALQFIGLEPGEATIAAIAWGPRADADLDTLAAAEGWTREDAVLKGGPHVLDAFGITDVERGMLPPERWDELVFERVALADVLKA